MIITRQSFRAALSNDPPFKNGSSPFRTSKEEEMILRLALIAVVIGTTPGCSSMISAYKNRAVSKHGISYKDKFSEGQVFIMTGERRMAVVYPMDAAGPKFKFCPESLPEVASAIGAASSLSLATGKATAGIRDEVVQSLIQTSNRTENAELLRQWSFLVCSAWAQGAAVKGEAGTDSPYWNEIVKMSEALAKIMTNNSTKTVTVTSTGQTVQALPTVTIVTAPVLSETPPKEKPADKK